MTDDDDDETPCRICGRRTGPVCSRCHHRMAEHLAVLPTLSDRLRYALVPVAAGHAERVTASPGEAPVPARMAALNLLAAGTDDARCVYVPTVRIWTTVDPVPTTGDGEPERVLSWHRELVYDDAGHLLLTAVDDQVGTLPIHEWLHAWSGEWRTRLDHRHIDEGNPLPVSSEPERAHQQDDPVAEEWDRRWPYNGWTPATRKNHDHLVTRLHHACQRHPHIAEFAASLRTLVGTIRAALGDVEDLEYLGRCPEPLTDGGPPCGADIWHDPYASVIACPRCHTETGQDRRIWLARRILDAWPIDRRRRYTRGLIDALRPVTCANCGKPVSVEWIDATERADRERFWRPGSIACPNRCELVE